MLAQGGMKNVVQCAGHIPHEGTLPAPGTRAWRNEVQAWAEHAACWVEDARVTWETE